MVFHRQHSGLPRKAQCTPAHKRPTYQHVRRLDAILPYCLLTSYHSVAYVAFPLALFIINSQRSEWPTELGITQKNSQVEINTKRLDTLIKVVKTSYERYDGVEGVVRTVRTVIDHIKRQHLPNPGPPANDRIELADNQLSWDLRLSIAIDWGLSNGKTPAYHGFELELQKLLGYGGLSLPLPPNLATTFETRPIRRHKTTLEEAECLLFDEISDPVALATHGTSNGKEDEIAFGPGGSDTNQDHESATKAIDPPCQRALWLDQAVSKGSPDKTSIEDYMSESITKTMREPFDLLPSFDEEMSRILDLPTGETWDSV